MHQLQIETFIAERFNEIVKPISFKTLKSMQDIDVLFENQNKLHRRLEYLESAILGLDHNGDLEPSELDEQ